VTYSAAIVAAGAPGGMGKLVCPCRFEFDTDWQAAVGTPFPHGRRGGLAWRVYFGYHPSPE